MIEKVGWYTIYTRHDAKRKPEFSEGGVFFFKT